jgi:dihydropteroate synthase
LDDGAAARSALARPLLAGVLNVTPDSFSDGGRWLDHARAVEHGLALAAAGADWIDVGGESTRPGAARVSADVQRERVLPVIEGLRARLDLPISIDTTLAAVADAALRAGATIVNDVSAGRDDPELVPLVAERGAGLVLMHMRGTPADMQREPRYADVLGEVRAFLAGKLADCRAAGIPGERLWIDPGIGFGKTLQHNLTLLRGLGALRELGAPILVGVSRKAFIEAVRAAQGLPPGNDPERLGGTLAAVLHCARSGAAVLRVHDVARAAEALALLRALEGPAPEAHNRPPT